MHITINCANDIQHTENKVSKVQTSLEQILASFCKVIP